MTDHAASDHGPARAEDARFLAGRGCYVDDLAPEDLAHAAVLRSPHAHARIVSIDTGAAAAAPGVLAVLTGEDWRASGYGNLPSRTNARFTDGSMPPVPPRPALAAERVRCIGDPVALVIAESVALARDALDLVEVDYEDLPAVVNPRRALEAGAPQVWDHVPGNLFCEFETGDAAAVAQAFAGAHRVVSCEMTITRVHAAPMETRGAIGRFDSATGRRTLICNAQNLRATRAQLAADVFRVEPGEIRLVAHDVGGGFGMKNGLYPEHALVLFAAERVGRPVKWIGERTESFLFDSHGREQLSRVELALDADGRFLAMRVDTVGNVGAYVGSTGGFTPAGGTARTQGGLYHIPAIHYHSRVAFTNTTTTEAYRGAGRPEANYQIERVVDVAAAALGIDPLELRRRNLLAPDQLPYATPMGMEIDCGDFPDLLARTEALAAPEGYAARAAESGAKGRLRGRGVATYLGLSGGARMEGARLRLAEDGGIDLYASAESIGQGHETVLPRLVAERLGVPLERVRYHQGDTDFGPVGGGHGGSRGLEMAGSAAAEASDQFIEAARPLAAHLLEAAEPDLAFDAGSWTVAGTDRHIRLEAVLEAAADPGRFPPETVRALDVAPVYEAPAASVPAGCHILEVEVDPETGSVTVERYATVHDLGHVVNEALADGQVHGAVAQGIGQALLEVINYDETSGQLLSGSLMDYALPRAADFGPMVTAYQPGHPTAANRLGVKGAGEAACGGSMPALVNAVADALAPLGVTRLDMPLTPERVWRAIREAGART